MRLIFSALGATFAFTVAIAAAQADGVQVKDAWARATPGGAQTAAAYATITSAAGDKLTGASTPVAKEAQLHNMTMEGSVMKMREVADIDLPAGKPVTLKPGGYHIMLTGLAQPLKEGQTVPLTLNFAKAGAQQVTVMVGKVGAMGPGGETSGGVSTPGMNMPMKH